MTSSAIKAAFHGDVPLPEIDPAEMVATAFGFQLDRQCTFDDAVAKVYRDAGSNASVYVSDGLAELLDPSTPLTRRSRQSFLVVRPSKGS